MPTFEFDDHIEPVLVKIGDDEFHALPGIPANDFAAFMEVFSQIPPLVAKMKAKKDSDGDDGEDTDSQFDAYLEFIQVSIKGLDLVMDPESIARIEARASDKKRPISATMLANVFSTLAGYYISGGKEAEDKKNPAPTDAARELSPSSDTTGGSSEDSSFSEAPPSIGGPITT